MRFYPWSITTALLCSSDSDTIPYMALAASCMMREFSECRRAVRAFTPPISTKLSLKKDDSWLINRTIVPSLIEKQIDI